MKTLTLIFALVIFSLKVFSQQKVEDYKQYKACTECLTSPQDNWKRTGLNNYGIPQQPVKNNAVTKQAKIIGGVLLGIVVSAVTYSLYNKVNTATNEIR